MSNIVNTISGMKSFRARKPADCFQIKEAEESLELNFSTDYKECLLAFGQVSIYGHEFTGICKTPRLNVVGITLEERDNNPSVPNDLYVIEQLHIDNIVIWQNSSGEVYQSSTNSNLIKIADSFLEFIEGNDLVELK